MTTNRSTRRTARTTRATRATRPARASRVLMLSTASVAGTAALIAGGYAQAVEPAPAQPAPSVVSKDPAPAPDRPVRVVQERGTVLSGTADVAGTPVIVELYENSTYGSSIQVVLGDVESDAIGHLEQPGAFLRDGSLDVTVGVNGTPVRLQGTVAPSGRPTKLVDPIQDNGERIIVKGSNTPLATDITVTVGGASAPVSFDPAFSFDLETRKVTLGGR